MSPLAPPRTDLVVQVLARVPLAGAIEAYVDAGIAPVTRRAYRTDLDHFKTWDGTLPATDAQVANYLADHAIMLKVSTLTHRLAAISVAHEDVVSSTARADWRRVTVVGKPRQVSSEKAGRMLGWTTRPASETILDSARGLQARGLG